jgi:hypothetical protein
MSNAFRLLLLLCIISLWLVGCFGQAPLLAPATGQDIAEDRLVEAAVEQPVTEIHLRGPLSRRRAQLSGMAWYGETLILLPQYPERFENQLFYLSKQEIAASIRGDTHEPLKPQPIPFLAGDLLDQIAGFQGFEAIAVDGERLYMTIEAGTNAQMMGYLVTGTIAPDLSEVRLQPERIAKIAPQVHLPNLADEALVVAGERVVTIYEVNGMLINFAPVAHVFDAGTLQALGNIPFPRIDYRITDATSLDEEQHFWAINSFSFPSNSLLLGEEALATRYGAGPTHQVSRTVERLVRFQYTENGITLVDAPPIQLQLVEGTPRNWEGIVRFNAQGLKGFLLVTDSRPATILAFVPMPR